MASRKITELTALTTPASDDVLPIIDVSETSAADQNKKITIPDLTGQLSAASTSAAGIVQLNNTTASTSTTQAATANAAKTAYDLANAAIPSSGNYAAKAWVNFNGTSTVAIRASGNVTSITDNGTGNYTVNFTTAISDTDYSAFVTSRRINAADINFSATLRPTSSGGTNYPLTTSSCTVYCGTVTNATLTDSDIVCVAVFR